jgi:hypothetical protein
MLDGRPQFADFLRSNADASLEITFASAASFRNILGTVREDAEPSFVPAFPDNLKTASGEIASRCRRL